MTLSGLLLAGVVSASVASGLIHLAVVAEHFATYRLAAYFFIVLGVFQLAWAALLVARPTRGLYLVGAAVSLGTIAVWAVSRTAGLPFGAFAGVAERVGRPDVISTILEEVIVVGVVILAFGNRERRTLGRRAYRAGWATLVGITGLFTLWALAAVRLAGHLPSPSGLMSSGPLSSGPMSMSSAGAGVSRLTVAASSESLLAAMGHHGMHLILAGGAVVAYFLYVVVHVRRHGWPSFSWQLDPGATSPAVAPSALPAPVASVPRT
ncbi:MAG: hypothetical protein NVSMB32_16200 [Actinomycetota bacterium]